MYNTFKKTRTTCISRHPAVLSILLPLELVIFFCSTWMTKLLFFFLWRCGPTRATVSSFLRFLDHTQRRITVDKTPLDKWSARRRDLYLTTHNTHNRQTSMPQVGFEPTISAGERPKTYTLDRAGTGTRCKVLQHILFPQWRRAPSCPGPLYYRAFTVTFRHATVGRTLLDE